MPNVVDINIRADNQADRGLNDARQSVDRALGGMRGLFAMAGGAMASSLAGPIVAAAGAAAAALASTGAAAGAFALAAGPQLAGVGAAAKAYEAAQESAAGGTVDNTRRMADAQRQLAAATRDAADRQKDALQQVEDAEDNLADAQRDARDAQESLNDARDEAAKDAKELAQQVKDAQFEIRDATHSVTEAEERLAEVRADPKSTASQIKRAELALEAAQRSLARQKEGLTELQQKQQEADRVGIEGSEKVKNAKDKLADANDKVVDAEQALAEARENVTRVQQQSADAIAAAQSAIAAAMQQAGAATVSFEDTLAKLPPATQETARAFIALKEETKAWSDSLAPKTMPVFTSGINILRDVIPMLTPLVVAASDAFQEFLDELGRDVNNGGLQDFINDLAESARETLPDFLHSLKNIAVGVGGIIEAFLPFDQEVTGGFRNATKAFADWGQGLENSKGFKSFMAGVREALPVIAEFFGSFLDAGKELAKGLEPIAGIGLDLIRMFGELLQAIPDEVLQALAPVIMGIVVAMKAWAVIQGVINLLLMANPIGLVIALLVAAAVAVYKLYQEHEGFRSKVQEVWAAIQETVMPALQELWRIIQDEVIPAFQDFIKALEPVVAFLIEKLEPFVRKTFENVMQIIRGALDIIIGIFKVFTGLLTGDWAKVWDGLKQIVSGVWDVIAGIVKEAWNRLRMIFTVGGELLWKALVGINTILEDAFAAMGRGMWNGLQTAWKWVWNGLVWIKNQIFGFFSGAGDWLLGVGSGIVRGIAQGIYNVGSWVKDALRWIIPDFMESFIPGFRTGGIIGAAGGGPRSNLVMVGEQGRELVRLPFGSTVIPNGQTEAMMAGAGSGGGGRTTLYLDTAGSRLDDLLVEVIRLAVRDRGGGDVQLVLGGT